MTRKPVSRPQTGGRCLQLLHHLAHASDMPAADDQRIAEEQRVAAERAEEEDMLAEAAQDAGKDVPRIDPEEAALQLLKSELGARPIGE